MESLAYSALLIPLANDPLVGTTDTHGLARTALLGSAAGLLLMSSTLPAGAIVVQGSNCDAVKDIQEALTAKKYEVGGVDGIFGAKTYAAVVKFQTDQKLEADGIVGVQTAEALGLTGDVYASGATCEAAASKPDSGSEDDQANEEPTSRKYTVVAEVLNVRSGPGTTNAVVEVLLKGDEVEALSSKPGWIEIEKGKWVSSRFVTTKSIDRETENSETSDSASNSSDSDSDTSSTSPKPTPITPEEDSRPAPVYQTINIEDLDPDLNTGYIKVMAEALNVRAEPNSDQGNVVGYVAKDEILPLTGKATKDGWIQLAWGDWVSAAFVQPVVVQ